MPMGVGTGGFAGHPLAEGTWAQGQLGPIVPVIDPAYAQVGAGELLQPAARAGVIYRDIPLVTISTSWGVQDVRAALQDLIGGLFDRPSQRRVGCFAQ